MPVALVLRRSVAGDDYCEHKLIMGTHTSGDEPNYLLIAKVLLPSENAVLDETGFDEDKIGEGVVAAPSCSARERARARCARAPPRSHALPPCARLPCVATPLPLCAQSWAATR